MELVFFLILTILFSAFFSGVEIAFVTSNKLKIELENKHGAFSARLLSNFIQKPARFIGTMLVGNNIALVVYGILMAKLCDPILEGWGFSEVWILLSQTLISTLIILFAGEFIPKTLFRINSNFILNLFALPLQLVYIILWPIMILMVGLSELIIKVIFRVDAGKQEVVFGRVDLDNYVKEITNDADVAEEEIDHEIHIFQNALDFSKVKARDCMVPRTEISAVEIEDDIAELKELFIETGHSKVLVYRDNIDNIIGYVNSADLFDSPANIKHVIVPVIIIPETISAKEVLEIFIKQNKSISVVVDEFGGTSGILTIEDIIEEIFGDIEDEHDRDDFIEEQIDENSFHFSARLEIDYLNDKYKLNLPESEEYETLAGLILNQCERIPELNAIVETEEYTFKITGVTNVRIESVRVEVLTED
ncbi:MAG TPA: hemolysin family protein [Cryomorphaceae bacterium]|nr:hemolysin family protein [Cryomorphaceae bacterium]